MMHLSPGNRDRQRQKPRRHGPRAFLLVSMVLVMSLLPAMAMAQTETSSPLQPSAPGAPLNAVGRVELVERYQVVLETGGRVQQVATEVGDQVEEGDLLLVLDDTLLKRDVERAEIDLELARLALAELTEEPKASEIAVAQARLLQSQETLALVEAGPTEEELLAAENSVAAAWAAYNRLKAGPTPAQVNQAKANLERAEVDLQQAQREYDKVAWLPEAAASAAADTLQKATIAYELAKAQYEEASKPTEQEDLLAALSAAQRAQDDFNRLQEKPTPAELADARAQVAAAEADLDQLETGPTALELQMAELRVQQALLNLEDAEQSLRNAQVIAPIAGTVLEMAAERGQQLSAGSPVAILADTSNVRLVVNVEQRDIAQVEIGQLVEVSIYALPDLAFSGVVEKIAPSSATGTGFVSFPVTVELDGEDLDRVLPGMTAAANFAQGTNGAGAAEASQGDETTEADETDNSPNGEDAATESDSSSD